MHKYCAYYPSVVWFSANKHKWAYTVLSCPNDVFNLLGFSANKHKWDYTVLSCPSDMFSLLGFSATYTSGPTSC